MMNSLLRKVANQTKRAPNVSTINRARTLHAAVFQQQQVQQQQLHIRTRYNTEEQSDQQHEDKPTNAWTTWVKNRSEGTQIFLNRGLPFLCFLTLAAFGFSLIVNEQIKNRDENTRVKNEAAELQKLKELMDPDGSGRRIESMTLEETYNYYKNEVLKKEWSQDYEYEMVPIKRPPGLEDNDDDF